MVIRVVKRGQFSICNCMRLSRIIKDKFSQVCSKFSQNCLRCTATGAICETLKIQVKFVLNSMRTQCDYLFITQRANFFGKLSMHIETESASPENKSTCSQTIHHTSSLTIAQHTERERLTIMYILRDKYNILVHWQNTLKTQTEEILFTWVVKLPLAGKIIDHVVAKLWAFLKQITFCCLP